MKLLSRTTTPQDTILKAILAIKEWKQAQLTLPQVATTSPYRPKQGSCSLSTIYCNTDAALRSDSKFLGLAWIFTERQELDRGSLAQDRVSSAIMANALAIRIALLHAASCNYTHIWLCSDSQGLVRTITQRRRTVELYEVLSDIDCDTPDRS